MTRRPKAPRTARLALPALALAGAIAALSAVPVARAPRCGDPDPAFYGLPGGERPVPDRPERPNLSTPPAILTDDAVPPPAPALVFTRPTETDGPRDGFRPRVERPPTAR